MLSHHYFNTCKLIELGYYDLQVLQNVLNHSNKISLCIPELQQQKTSQKSETNGNTSPESDINIDSKLNPPESQSPLHWLADLAEQKAREEKKGKMHSFNQIISIKSSSFKKLIACVYAVHT